MSRPNDRSPIATIACAEAFLFFHCKKLLSHSLSPISVSHFHSVNLPDFVSRSLLLGFIAPHREGGFVVSLREALGIYSALTKAANAALNFFGCS